MRRYNMWVLGLIFLSACANGQNHKSENAFAKLPIAKPGQKVATFAGGCFWALAEGLSELKGVNEVVSGYAGGTVKNPSYEEVCSDRTGHAEAVQVYYDPEVVSYAELAESFFYAHDPTTLNRQGPDEGEDYRSIAFYRTSEEQRELKTIIAKVNASHHYSDAIVTEVVPIKVFYPAENYHQDYFKLHPGNSYIQSVSAPKVMKLRKNRIAYLKPEFKM